MRLLLFQWQSLKRLKVLYLRSSFDEVMMDFDVEDEEFEYGDDVEEDINVLDLENRQGRRRL